MKQIMKMYEKKKRLKAAPRTWKQEMISCV